MVLWVAGTVRVSQDLIETLGRRLKNEITSLSVWLEVRVWPGPMEPGRGPMGLSEPLSLLFNRGKLRLGEERGPRRCRVKVGWDSNTSMLNCYIKEKEMHRPTETESEKQKLRQREKDRD